MEASQGWERKRILITVKTYPTPSAKYRETVCTAGVTSDGRWIRLYPVSFRYRPYEDWYKKYQWVEVDVKRKVGDTRLETHIPNCDTFDLQEHLDTSHGWERGWGARRAVVLPTAAESLHALQNSGASLGAFRPAEVMVQVGEGLQSVDRRRAGPPGAAAPLRERQQAAREDTLEVLLRLPLR
jgi:hypothetical protein